MIYHVYVQVFLSRFETLCLLSCNRCYNHGMFCMGLTQQSRSGPKVEVFFFLKIFYSSIKMLLFLSRVYPSFKPPSFLLSSLSLCSCFTSLPFSSRSRSIFALGSAPVFSNTSSRN